MEHGLSFGNAERVLSCKGARAGGVRLARARPAIQGAWENFLWPGQRAPRTEPPLCDEMTVTALLGPLDIPAAAGSERTGKRTVLLVDDDADALTLISEMLRFLGHHVVTAQDGRQALTRLRNTRGIDCLLTDVVMPHGMNGLQLMWAARSARPGLRTALASVRSRDDLRSMGEIPHDVAFFTKPYSLPDISAYLNEV